MAEHIGKRILKMGQYLIDAFMTKKLIFVGPVHKGKRLKIVAAF